MRKAGHRAGVRTCLHFPAALLRLELFSGGFPRRWAAARRKWMRLYQRRQRRCRRIQRARDGSRLTKAHDKRRRCPKGPRRQKAKCCEEKKLARRAETRHRPRRKERLAKPRRKRPAGVVDAPLARNGVGTWPERFRLATATCASSASGNLPGQRFGKMRNLLHRGFGRHRRFM
jgi:hypothetical protein